MVEEKICPIMSRPTMGNIKTFDGEPLYKDENQMREYGWYPIGGFPYQQIIVCLQGQCMAWVPECPRLNAADRECETEDCIAMDRDFSGCKGGCRLI